MQSSMRIEILSTRDRHILTSLVTRIDGLMDIRLRDTLTHINVEVYVDRITISAEITTCHAQEDKR